MIWCVEDDAGIRDIETYALQSAGFQVRGFENGVAFWEALKSERPMLVILDVMLPELDGVTLLRRMKESAALCEIPVIMATAKGTEYDKVQSLDLGADDYLVKPFGVMELISRVKAVLRRCQKDGVSHLLQMGELILDLSAHTVTVEGERVELTLKEFELLHLLLSQPNRVFTRDQLYSCIWGQELAGETRTVDIHIRTLRQKIGHYADCIHTVRGVGYRLEVMA